MRNNIKSAIVILLLFTVIAGIIYPLLVTGISQLVFNHQANGSMVVINGKCYGSELIGQQFSGPKYFWGRLSATSPSPYNAAASSGSNLGPLNPALQESIELRIKALKSYDTGNNGPVPVDLVTCSASGLDPHISLAAALYQSHRVAAYRGITDEKVLMLINKAAEPRQFGILGEPRVNVLILNLALDNML